MSDAIVVGSGPNGLACAATLATRGFAVTVIEAAETIGGGTRSAELTLPGVIHDECSAVHSMAVGSPALTALGLERHGLEWAWPEVDLAHPLDGGEGAAMLRSIERTGRRPRLCRRRPGSASSAPRRRLRRPRRGHPAAARCTCRATRCGWPASACRRRAGDGAGPRLRQRRRRGPCSAASPPTPSPAAAGRSAPPSRWP